MILINLFATKEVSWGPNKKDKKWSRLFGGQGIVLQAKGKPLWTTWSPLLNTLVLIRFLKR
jgi:hypothetical protein